MSKAVYIFGSFLMHHGKKGQKWGVRNGPPYPLDQEGKERLRKQRMESYGKDKTGMSAFLSRNENQRSMQTRYTLPNGQTGIVSPKEGIGAVALRGKERSFENASNDVNWLREKYPDDPQYQNNCVSSASALIDNKKGIYVGAGPNEEGVSNYAVEYYFDGTKREEPSIDNLKDTLLSHGEGSYGILNTYTDNDHGHATVWEVQNNEVLIHDSQVNKHYTFDNYKNDVGINEWGGTSIYDLTTATPNLTHQFEDHAIYALDIYDKDRSFTQDELNSIPDEDKGLRFSTSWTKNGRNYYGPSKEEAIAPEYVRNVYGIGVNRW